MQTTKKLFSAALLTLTSAAALLLASCAAPAATQNGKLKYGLPVPNHANYVRSPYTRPAQLVQLNGAQPGEIITCPYTDIDFIVPGLTGKRYQERLKAANERKTAAAHKTKTPKHRETAPSPGSKPALQSLPRETVADQPLPSMITPSEEPPTADELLAAPPAVRRNEIPFGINIPGKPGYVRSPFAAAHQFVDVTGLPVGSEVKCPYTDRIFRVPAL